MKIGILLVFCVAYGCARIRQFSRHATRIHPLSDEMINEINAMRPLWKVILKFKNVKISWAAHYLEFVGRTLL